MGIVVDSFVPLALAFIRFALGIGLTVDDFTRVARRPHDSSSAPPRRWRCCRWSPSRL
jgi:predicted Na+-dependent transporter